LNTYSYYQKGSVEYLEFFLKDDPEAVYYYRKHIRCVVICRRFKGRVTDMGCNNNELMKIIGNYDVYKNVQNKSLSMGFEFKVDRFGFNQFSLMVGDSEIMIGGLFGSNSPIELTDMPFLDGDVLNDETDVLGLKFMIEFPKEMGLEVSQGIEKSDSDVYKTLRTRIYMMKNEKSYMGFKSSTKVSLDTEMPDTDNEFLKEMIEEPDDLAFISQLAELEKTIDEQIKGNLSDDSSDCDSDELGSLRSSTDDDALA
jgi:hypothetical protein